jgi:processive 1,2-diacylglycerol beta-glucosyltransferase
MFERVLILSASAGAGHVRAAQALEKAFAVRGAARQIRHEDALNFTSPMVRGLYSKGYIDMVNHAPTILGILYDKADRPWKDEENRLAFDRLNTRPLSKLLQSYSPDLVVCTHFLPSEIISYLLCKKKIKARHAITVTDFDVHAMWLCRHFDDYFVAMDETREHLQHLGVPGQRVTVSGIPIDPVFVEPKSKESMRAKLGLRQDLPVILMSAGGYGVGPVEEMLKSLQTMRHAVQVLALCGRNADLKERLESFAENPGNVIIKPVAFTDAIDEYMAASDLLLGKPGGLTTSEALAKGLAFVVVNPIPGQEERNSDHLLEEGVAIRCNNLPTLAYKIDRLLDDPARLAAMHANARDLGRPDSALAIVDRLLLEPAATVTVNLKGEHSCRSPLSSLAKLVARPRRALSGRKAGKSPVEGKTPVAAGRIASRLFKRKAK